MRQKLKLNLDDLKVESFQTSPSPSSGYGTVFGQGTDQLSNCADTCDGTCTFDGTVCTSDTCTAGWTDPDCESGADACGASLIGGCDGSVVCTMGCGDGGSSTESGSPDCGPGNPC
jgi:hypothetical protein